MKNTFIKLTFTLATALALDACNGSNSASSSTIKIQSSSLQQYIDSLTYTSINSKQVNTPPITHQQSFITPGGLTINSIDIKFYSGANCSDLLAYTKTLNGSIVNPVIPSAGTYTSSNASNNALCGDYVNNQSVGCLGLYSDMSAGTMRSMQFTYNVINGYGGSSSIVGECMYNQNATIGSTAGVEGIANWSPLTLNSGKNQKSSLSSEISAACSGGECGFSQAYSVDITPPAIYLSQTGQTPTSPLDPAPTGSDGYVYAGIPWAYVSSGNTTPNPRFTDDGCQVTDNLTGLIWIKDPSTVNSGNALTWYDALTTAASGTWCGQTAGSWRMPNFNEAMSLLNFAVVDNSTWLNNQNFNNISRLDHYWISTTIAGNNAYVFTMIFSSSVFGTNGIDKPNPIGKLFPVRGTTTTPALVPQTGQTPTLPYTATAGSDGALQEGTAWPSPRFTTDSGTESNCITDKLTGLTWVRDPSTINSATKLPWSSALYIVGSGNWCGYSDWRVPNINEFRSLLNYAYSNSSAWLMYGTGDSTSPNCDGACFINISNNRYWTSTTNPSNISNALCLDIQGGGYSNFPKDGTVEDWDPIPRYDCAAWAVRGGS